MATAAAARRRAVAYGAVFDGVALPAALGAALIALAAAAAAMSRGGTGSQCALPALGMAMVALMIHAGRGHIEAHFAVFCFLACTVVYRQMLPVLVGAGTIAVHHLTFNYLQAWGWGPLCFTEPGLLRVVEHAVFVIGEAGVLLFLVHRAREEFSQGEELRRLVDGLLQADGTVDFRAAHGPAATSVARQMQQVLQRIETTIVTMQSSAQAIQVAAGHVGAGSQDLSQRTEHTTENLQRTARSVETLTGAVGTTADSARTARQLAEDAAGAAQRGTQMVSQVVSTMEGINGSSRRIADIIGVIDGIAFQTNILALNAAVEAARAGEQGRGFAVVAGEVRALAQRSASAAREIKSLITSSVDQVEQGAQRVADAGHTMDGLLKAVQRVNEVIAGISAATAEQSDGVGQVHAAIGELDDMTRRNARLVEQSAAASASLLEQAQRLGASVRAFRVSGAVH